MKILFYVLIIMSVAVIAASAALTASLFRKVFGERDAEHRIKAIKRFRSRAIALYALAAALLLSAALIKISL